MFQVTIILPFSVMFATIVRGSVSQLLNQSFRQSVRYPTAQSVNCSISHSVSQSGTLLHSQSIAQSVILSASQVPYCTVSQLLNQSFCQPVRYPTPQSVSCSISSFCQSVRYPTVQSVSCSISHSVSCCGTQVHSQSVSQFLH